MRIRVGVLMGGASSEREISLASGRMIAEHLPRDRYDVVMLDTLALMGGNPRIGRELQEKARALLARRGEAEVLPERDRELPAAFQEQIRSAAAETLPPPRSGSAAAPSRQARWYAWNVMPKRCLKYRRTLAGSRPRRRSSASGTRRPRRESSPRAQSGWSSGARGRQTLHGR